MPAILRVLICWAVLCLVGAAGAVAQQNSEGDAFGASGTQTTTKTGEQVLGVDVADFGAVPNDSTDDSAAIQAALDHPYPIARISRPGTYIIGATRQLVPLPGGNHVATLTIRPFKTLWCAPGVIIKLANQSNCLMIANKSGNNGDNNITIDGGTWDANGIFNDMRAPTVPVTEFGGSGGYRPYWCGAAMQLVMCRNLRVQNLTVLRAKKYAIYVAGGNNIAVNNITFDTYSDGVHLNGPASKIRISNIRGLAHDNLIAIIASEGAYYPEITGDALTTARNVTDLEITDIVCGAPGKPTFQPFRFTGRPTDTISNVRIRRVSGDASLTGHGFAFSDDNADCDPGPGVTPAGLEHSIMRDFVIEDVSLKVAPGYSLFQIGGSGVEDITIRRAEQVSPDNPLVTVNNNADLKRLVIEDVFAPDNNSRLVNIEAKVQDLQLRRLIVESSNIARVLQIAIGARAPNVLVEDCGFIGAAQQIMQWWDAGTCNLTLRRTTMVTDLVALQTMSEMIVRSENNVWQAKTALAAISAGYLSLEGSGDICTLPVGLDSRGRGIRVNNVDMRLNAYLLTPRIGDRVYNVNIKRDEVPAGTGVLSCIKAGTGPTSAKWSATPPSAGRASVRVKSATPATGGSATLID